jgi:hypothetical protein
MGQTRVDRSRWAGEWVSEWDDVVHRVPLPRACSRCRPARAVPVPCPHPSTLCCAVPCFALLASCPACRSSPCSKSSGSRRTTLWRRWRSFSSSLCTGAERLLLTRSRTWTLPPSERAHPPITAHIWPRILRCIAGVTQPCPVDGSLTHPHLITGAYPQ